MSQPAFNISPRAQALLKPKVFGVYARAHAKPVKEAK